MVEIALGEAEEGAGADETADFEGGVQGGGEGAAEDEMVGYLVEAVLVVGVVGGRLFIVVFVMVCVVDDSVEYLLQIVYHEVAAFQ